MAKISSITAADTTFADVKAWYEANMSPSVMNFDDPKPYEVYSEGKFAATFQCTGQGAQRLFRKAKPKSIIDIAALTSIYRPGPLAAHVDKLWLEHEKVPFDWGHPLINETLKETRGLLVFQEGVMALANKVAGFPMNETDEVRRAIMKRSISGGEAAKKKMKELEDSFVEGCVKNGVPRATGEKAYETICFMSGYGFNKAHAVAYAIDSFWCAWLLTYYEADWLAACLEIASKNADKLTKAIEEAKSLGWTVSQLDINLAGLAWTAFPETKSFVPSFKSCKSIGDAAVEEIMANRPYKNIQDLLWSPEDGSWRHSKANKRVFENLIKLEALQSMDIVGPGKTFESYKQMHHVVIEHMDELKKTPKKDPFQGKRRLNELIVESMGMGEWTRSEKIAAASELLGDVSLDTIMSSKVYTKLKKLNLQPINEFVKDGIYWFIAEEIVVKKTKTGKKYLLMKAFGEGSKRSKIFAWGYDPTRCPLIEPYDVCLAELSQSDFGFAAQCWKLKVVNFEEKINDDQSDE